MKQVLFILLVFISFCGFSQGTIETVKIDSLEVMTEDLGKITWKEAKAAVENLGDGWRLPTIQELQFMYDKRDEIGGFKFKASDIWYWSSKEDYTIGLAWAFYFTTYGKAYTYQKSNEAYVRAVRDLE